MKNSFVKSSFVRFDKTHGTLGALWSDYYKETLVPAAGKWPNHRSMGMLIYAGEANATT